MTRSRLPIVHAIRCANNVAAERIEDADPASDRSFDLILLGDALVRVDDIAAFLGRARRLLAPGGYITLLLDNIAHWSSIRALMQGLWPAGRDPQRAFTIKSMAAELAGNGFRLIKTRSLPRPVDKAQTDAWLTALGDLATHMGLDRAGVLEMSSDESYVMVAQSTETRPAAPLQIVSAAMAPNFMAVRTRLPAQHLRAVPEVNLRYQEGSLALPHVAGNRGKILILQRLAARDRDVWKQAVGAALRDGWLVINEYDDHPELVGKVLNWPDERDRWLAAKGSHAVQTSTRALADAYRPHNPAVMAFPNAAFTLPPMRVHAPGPRRIFYGALNRGDFSVALAQAIAPAIAAHPDTLFDVLHDRAFFDALPTDRKSFREGLGYEAYLDAMGACNIALLPLAGDDFELFKSDVKYVEAASRGTAVIASPAVYDATIDPGRTGLIAGRLEDWAPALVRLLEDDALLQRLSVNAWEDVRDNRMFAAQMAARVDWYRMLWSQRDELNAALLARCPWLAEG